MSEEHQDDLKKTPLYELQKKLGGKFVPFCGWSMPAFFKNIKDEHTYVRSHVGIFDVSHMGEIVVQGKDAKEFLNSVITNDLERLKSGFSQYTVMCTEDGGIIDDMIIYCQNENSYFICVNASNREKDFAWLCQQKPLGRDIHLEDQSDSWCQIAVQGPESDDLLRNILGERFPVLEFSQFTEVFWNKEQRPFIMARTGYTGERGCELYVPKEFATALWEELLNNNVKALPIGLGARNTLRLEACYHLYGDDMDQHKTPYDVGLSWVVKLDKKYFIGQKALAKQKEAGSSLVLTAFLLDEPGIARDGMEIRQAGLCVGKVTSGSYLPTLNESGGLASLDLTLYKENTPLTVVIRDKEKKIKLVPKPLYKPRTK